MEINIGDRILSLKIGDITEVPADGIVNAANSALAGGGGVDGAIHRAGGPGIMEECRKIGHCPTGKAVITSAGNLPAKHVIHAVGPIWRGGENNEPDLLKSAYLSSLALAEKYKLQSVTFPSISTGAYGYPVDKAAEIALEAVTGHFKKRDYPKKVTFVLFSDDTFRAYEKALDRLIT